MNKTKEAFVFGFALFAGFFGAGNLILPPLLGFNAGPDWWLVAIGFIASATIIPLFALFAHARLQGTMLEFGKKVSPLFALVYSLSLLIIAIALPCPRTAAVTYEMSIAPYFEVNSLITSSIYFILVFVFVINRSNVLQLLGKYLMPLIVLILLVIIGIAVFSPNESLSVSTYEIPLLSGFMEGYQTYDAIAGVLMGGVVVISLNLKGYTSVTEKRKIIAKSGLIAMIGLFIMYAGLIAAGALNNNNFDQGVTRVDLLSGLATLTLGNVGAKVLSLLVGLACFTTAVGIIVGTSDFFKKLFNDSQKAYLLAAIVACLVGVLVGQMDVHYIIEVALPALMFIYPLTIVLIFLNVVPENYSSNGVFRAVVLVTFIFSIPDFLGFLVEADWLLSIKKTIPFAQNNLGWVLPAVLTFIVTNVFLRKK